MKKKSKVFTRTRKQEPAKRLRIVPQNGHLWFVAGDVCGLLGLIERRALAVIPETERATAEVETQTGGQMCQIISVGGFFSLIRTNRTLKGLGLAEYLKKAVIPDAHEKTFLLPESLQAFEAGFDELVAFFSRVATNKTVSNNPLQQYAEV